MSGFVFKFGYYTLFIFRKFERLEYTQLFCIINTMGCKSAWLPLLMERVGERKV